jgi:hypothetical protein
VLPLRSPRPELAARTNFGALGAIAILVVVFERNVVLRDLAGPYFTFVGVRSILDALYDAGFKRLPFFQQFSGALGVRTFHWREAAIISAPAARGTDAS